VVVRDSHRCGVDENVSAAIDRTIDQSSEEMSVPTHECIGAPPKVSSINSECCGSTLLERFDDIEPPDTRF
jgi:hypothetical protein